MASTLTSGQVPAIYKGETLQEPVFQIINLRELPPKEGQPKRYRLLISDGTYFMQSMLTTQLNNLVADGKIQPNTTVRLLEYVINDFQSKKLVIVLRAEVVGQHAERIGKPVNYDKVLSGEVPAPSAPSGALAAAPRTSVRPAEHGGARSRAPVSAAPEVGITPVAQINPYANRWTIKGRITEVAPIRTWSNARGDGKLFSIDILDRQGNDIRGTFFNENVDKFHPTLGGANPLKKGQVYTFSGGRVKVANPRYNTCSSEYEINFNNGCEVVPAHDDSIQQVVYRRTRIAELENLPVDSKVDVIGVIQEFEPMRDFTSKKGNQLTKRDLTIADESGASVRVTLWGDLAKASEDSFEGNPVVLVTKCKLGDYGGRSLSSGFSGSQFFKNPSFAPEMQSVQSWYSNGGGANLTSLTGAVASSGNRDGVQSRKTLGAIDDENLGTMVGDDVKPDFISSKAYITFVKTEKYCYPADPNTNKKLIHDASGGGPNGVWRNEADGTEFEKPHWRYILQCQIGDHTASRWATVNDKTAEQIVGKSANEMKEIESGPNGESAVADIFNELSFKCFNFGLMVKSDTYNDETRKRVRVFRADPVNYATECKELTEAIAQYNIA